MTGSASTVVPLFAAGASLVLSIVYLVFWPKPRPPASSRPWAMHVVLRWFHALVWAAFALASLCWTLGTRQLAQGLSLFALVIYGVFLVTLALDRRRAGNAA